MKADGKSWRFSRCLCGSLGQNKTNFNKAQFSVIIKYKEGQYMHTEYTAIIKQQGDWWIGWIEEVPGVNCQERTRQELIESLRLTLKEAIEFNKEIRKKGQAIICTEV